MTNSISSKIQKTLLWVLLVVTVLFLAIGIPVQFNMARNSAELVCFSLDVIARRDNNNLANELFENRNAAIRLHMEEILQVQKVLSVSVYDRSGALVEAATSITPPPDSLTPVEMGAADYLCEEGQYGFTFIKPIRAVGETFGWIRIVYDMSDMRRQTVIYYLFFGGLLALMLSSAFILLRWRLRRLITDPIQALDAAMQSAEVADMAPVASQNLASELASLFTTYNDMSRRLQETYTELDQRKGQLEEALNEAAEKTDALSESEARFRTIVSEAPVGIFIFNNSGVVVDANEYIAGIMGAQNPAQINGIDMLRDIDDENVVRCVREAIETGASYYEDYYTSISGQRTVFIRVRIQRINAELLCAVFEDLTEHKKTLKALSESEKNLAELNRELELKVAERTQALTDQKDRLKRANVRLQELDRLKTAFLSSVSHELRTPLTSILGFTKITHKQLRKHISPLVADNPEAAAKSRAIEENLTIVTHEGERLSRLVNDVLDLARIESGRMPWNDRPVAVSELMQKAVSAAAGDFQQTGVTLITDIEPDLPEITIDPDKLTQVVRNLLHNSAKFTEEGNVTVKATHRADDNEIEIRVHDTGPGITASNINSVFEKFHQIDSDHEDTEKPKGSGLGLAICKQIVEHYEGRIWVESEPGMGATFFIRLPV